ncbi:hypothetical protein SAMN04515656_10994 [Eubacterium aggregans]|uniref:Uncharacterized protein n=1 Tax=Eubacterium aggregans TaxID=81409 RepID=A0A1H4AYT3_9FIRM|nr:hypothetical protein [Eubacterium aggregans]SEA40812.1 hypothetical protein SAMN04515656_10994 [Eubacterium aggregans]
MKNRFNPTQKSRSILKDSAVTLAVFFLVAGVFILGIFQVSSASNTEEIQNLKNAVQHAVVHCYATEGRYPQSLSYLEEHYGLSYDNKKYLVDYTPYGTNIFPGITIIPLGGSS